MNKLTIDKKDGLTMNVIYYACSRSDGILSNVRLFSDMSEQEQEKFKRELIITSAKEAGYKVKNGNNTYKERKK